MHARDQVPHIGEELRLSKDVGTALGKPHLILMGRGFLRIVHGYVPDVVQPCGRRDPLNGFVAQTKSPRESDGVLVLPTCPLCQGEEWRRVS